MAGIVESLMRPRADATLCHGLSGLGEVALIASEVLGDETYRVKAFTLAQALIDRHSASGEWPSGLIWRVQPIIDDRDGRGGTGSSAFSSPGRSRPCSWWDHESAGRGGPCGRGLPGRLSALRG